MYILIFRALGSCFAIVPLLRHIPLPDSSSLLPIWHLVFLAKDVPGLPVPLPHTLPPHLFGFCGFSSSFARWLAVLCSLSFPLSPSFSLLCLDFLTKDCQGFQLITSLSFPPDCTLSPSLLRALPHSAAVYQFVGSGLLLPSCFVSRCLNCLAKDVSGFSTLALLPACFWFVCVGLVSFVLFCLLDSPCCFLSWWSRFGSSFSLLNSPFISD